MSLTQYQLSQNQLTQRNLTQRNLTQQRTFRIDPFGLFKPTMWVNAANVEKDGDNFVSQLNDLSGNDFNPVQTTQANKPLWIDDEWGGQPILRFDGNDTLRADFTVLVPCTYIFVWKNTGAINSRSIAVSGTGSQDQLNGYRENQVVYQFNDNVNSYAKTSPFPNPILTTIIFNETSSQIFENGELKVAGNSGSGGSSGIILGGSQANLQGDIAELIFYNRLLTTLERTTVENYLMKKYAL